MAMSESLGDADENPYADLPTPREAMLNPWTWIGTGAYIVGITAPMFVFPEHPEVAMLSAISGGFGAVVAKGVVDFV